MVWHLNTFPHKGMYLSLAVQKFFYMFISINKCRGGEIGRHAGLKILFPEKGVPVRPWPAVQKLKTIIFIQNEKSYLCNRSNVCFSILC